MKILHAFFCIFIAFAFCNEANAQFYTIFGKAQTAKEEADDATNKRDSITEEDEENSFMIDTIADDYLYKMKQRQYLCLPIDSLRINSPYGYRTDPFTFKRKFHKGIDFYADYNYVYSIMPGRVIRAGKNKSLGNFVQVDHGDFSSIYGHLYNILVIKNEALEAGQPVGISGSSGRSTGEHLHFQLMYQNKTIDPLPILLYIKEIGDSTKKELEKVKKGSISQIQ